MSSSITLETLKNLFKLPATSCKYQRFVFPIVGLFCNSIFKMKIGFHFYDVPLQGVEVYLLYTHTHAVECSKCTNRSWVKMFLNIGGAWLVMSVL